MPPPRPPIFAQPRCVPGVSTPPGGPRPALPRVVKLSMAARTGLGTAIYASGYTGGALIAAACSATLLLPLVGGRWRGVFLAWGLVAALSLVAWLGLARVAAQPAEPRPAA